MKNVKLKRLVGYRAATRGHVRPSSPDTNSSRKAPDTDIEERLS